MLKLAKLKNQKVLICLMCCFTFFSGDKLFASTGIDKTHTQAVELARDGKYSESIELFEHIIQKNQKNQNDYLLEDFALVLSWSGNCKKSISLFSAIKLPTIGSIKNAAKCYRNLKEYKNAISLYKQAYKKDKSIDTAIGLAYSFAENKETEKALDIITSAYKKQGSHSERLMAEGYIYEAGNDYVSAFNAYSKVLPDSLDYEKAITNKYEALRRLGAYRVAFDMAKSEKKEQKLLNTLKGDVAAQHIRWGKRISPEKLEDRWVETDNSIALLSELINENSNNLRAQYDMMSAMLDKGDAKKVLLQFARMDQKGMPSWVLETAADAFMLEMESKKAKAIYEKLLKKDPENYNLRLKLFQTYAELQQYKEAGKILNKLSEENSSPYIYEGNIRVPNWRKVEIETASIWLLAYQDKLSEANEKFKKLLALAPFNTSIHSGLAHTYLWNSEPQKAIREFDWILSNDPDYTSARVGKTYALLNMGQTEKAEEELVLLANNMESGSVIKLNQRWQIENEESFTLYSNYRREEEGGKDWSLDMGLESRQLFHKLRFNFGYLRHQIEAGSRSMRESRVLAGFGYKPVSTVQFIQQLGVDGDSGLSKGSISRFLYGPNDYIKTNISYDNNTFDIPLRARIKGVTGNSANFGIQFLQGSIKKLELSSTLSRLSDSNSRRTYGVSYSEKFPSGKFRNFLGINLGFSDNSSDDASYFNPDYALEYRLSGKSEWSLKVYKKSLKQIVYFSLGGYDQSGFAPGFIGDIRYEHQWGIAEGESISYYISWNRRVYDRQAEEVPLFGFSMLHHL